MFGYIRPLKGELKVRDYELFRAVYCGLCHALEKSCGFSARFVLSFEFTFLAMLLSDGGQSCFERRRCPASPFRKKCCVRTDASLETAAYYSVVLTWWKLKDSVGDEGFFASLGARLGLLALRRSYKRALKARPEFDALVRARLSELNELEAAGCDSIDRAADKFALILCAASAGVEGVARRRELESLLYHAGRVVYILDALDDLERDMKKGAYNPVALRFSLDEPKLSRDSRERLERTLTHSQSFMISAFNLLPESPYTPIT